MQSDALCVGGGDPSGNSIRSSQGVGHVAIHALDSVLVLDPGIVLMGFILSVGAHILEAEALCDIRFVARALHAMDLASLASSRPPVTSNFALDAVGATSRSGRHGKDDICTLSHTLSRASVR